MSLVNKTVWVVGGVGVIGRSITKSLLSAGATVVVNSREKSRLDRLTSDLGHPSNLVAVKGSLLPGRAEKTVDRVLKDGFPLHHVVAHGAVRYWKKEASTTLSKSTGYDETYSLDHRRMLDMDEEEFKHASGQLVSLHFSAARALLPRLESSISTGLDTSYTFVTGDGGGHPSSIRSAAGELNSYHVWGLSAALRSELKGSKVACREIRVGLPVNRPEEERLRAPRERPLSGDIGDLCAGLVCSNGEMDGGLLEVKTEEILEKYLDHFDFLKDMDADEPMVEVS